MQRVIDSWRADRFVVLTSPETRAELASVLARPKIRKMSVVSIDDLVRGIERFTLTIPGRLTVSGACRDPKDDKFLACSVEGEANYLISSDRDLLEMKKYQDIAILNPGQFLLALELYSLNAEEMIKHFGHEALIGIRETIFLERDTSIRLESALNL